MQNSIMLNGHNKIFICIDNKINDNISKSIENNEFFSTFQKLFIFSSVFDGSPDDDPVRDVGGRRDDDHLPHLHPQPALLTLGRILNRLHRTWSLRVHDPLENQPGKLKCYDDCSTHCINDIQSVKV